MKKAILLLILVLVVVFVSAYTAPNYNNIELVLDSGYTAPTYQNINLVLSDVTADTCTAPSPATEWKIDLSDNCIITSDTDIRPYGINCYGTGSLGIYANLYLSNFSCTMDNILFNKSGSIWFTKE